MGKGRGNDRKALELVEECFSSELEVARTLMASLAPSLESPKLEWSGELINSLIEARELLNAILEDERYPLMKLGASGLAVKKAKTFKTANQLMGNPEASPNMRASLIKRLDTIDELESELEEHGEDQVLADMQTELEYNLHEAKIVTLKALQALRKTA